MGTGKLLQVGLLQRRLHLLVATPGRLLDLMDGGAVSLDTVRVLVLDEVGCTATLSCFTVLFVSMVSSFSLLHASSDIQCWSCGLRLVST